MDDNIKFDDYGSHLAVLEKIFTVFEVKSVLEFGLGDFSTSFFVTHSRLVVSVEQESREWHEKIKAKINSENWHSVFQPDPREVFRHFDAAGQRFDLIFSDGLATTRCLVANMAMERNVPLVLLHDAEKIWYYQWNLLDIPANYSRFDFRNQQGSGKVTTVLANNSQNILEQLEIDGHERILQAYSTPNQPVFQLQYGKLKSSFAGRL
jgi:hypothetical protein